MYSQIHILLFTFSVYIYIADSAPGTIRGDFAIDVGRNICHGSDSVESAEREIGLWFCEGLNTYASHSDAWINE